jgi:hypothetical protein
MAIYTLAIYAEYDLSVELFSSRKAAQDAFMRDLYENYQGCDLPDKYDEAEISEFIGAIGESLVWSIEKHSGYTDAPGVVITP